MNTDKPNTIGPDALSRIYRLGAWLAGGLLCVGVALRLAEQTAGGHSASPSAMSQAFTTAGLLLLWTIPVAGLVRIGLARVYADSIDKPGWLALLIASGLLVIWLIW